MPITEFSDRSPLSSNLPLNTKQVFSPAIYYDSLKNSHSVHNQLSNEQIKHQLQNQGAGAKSLLQDIWLFFSKYKYQQKKTTPILSASIS